MISGGSWSWTNNTDFEDQGFTIKLYLYSLVWESNPHQRIKSPLHYHYANQGGLALFIIDWKWWDLNPYLLYAKQIFYQLYYIPSLDEVGFEPTS